MEDMVLWLILAAIVVVHVMTLVFLARSTRRWRELQAESRAASAEMDKLVVASAATIRLAHAADMHDLAGGMWHAGQVSGGIDIERTRSDLDAAMAELDAALDSYRKAVRP